MCCLHDLGRRCLRRGRRAKQDDQDHGDEREDQRYEKPGVTARRRPKVGFLRRGAGTLGEEAGRLVPLRAF